MNNQTQVHNSVAFRPVRHPMPLPQGMILTSDHNFKRHGGVSRYRCSCSTSSAAVLDFIAESCCALSRQADWQQPPPAISSNAIALACRPQRLERDMLLQWP